MKLSRQELDAKVLSIVQGALDSVDAEDGLKATPEANLFECVGSPQRDPAMLLAMHMGVLREISTVVGDPAVLQVKTHELALALEGNPTVAQFQQFAWNTYEKSVRRKINAVVVEAIAGADGVEEEQVTPEKDIGRDLGADSMSMMEIQFRLERILGMELPLQALHRVFADGSSLPVSRDDNGYEPPAMYFDSALPAAEPRVAAESVARWGSQPFTVARLARAIEEIVVGQAEDVSPSIVAEAKKLA